MNIKIKNRQVLGIAALICNIALGTTLTSCNNWLDVRPETEQKEEDQFSTENGFQMAFGELLLLPLMKKVNSTLIIFKS